MTDQSPSSAKPTVSRLKVYSSAFGIFLLVNLAVQTGVTLLENITNKWLYPTFPFIGLGLAIITILAANHYIRHRAGKQKAKLWWRITKPILLVLTAYGLVMVSWFAVLQADLDRARADTEDARQALPMLPEPPVLTSPSVDTE